MSKSMIVDTIIFIIGLMASFIIFGVSLILFWNCLL